MTKAFVFGKFLPFHDGHRAMIGFALEQCDLLTVLVCCSDRETIPCSVRKAWIEAVFLNNDKIKVDTYFYREAELPNTSESSESVSKIWAAVFKNLLPDRQLLVTSEPYGDYVAGFMNIRHRLFDLERRFAPVSAAKIRENLWAYWHFLPAPVKPWFCIKVALLGTESTGKTTLARQLARHFGCELVLEAGRDCIPDSKQVEFDDLQRVATEHATRIEALSFADSPLAILDTDIHITKSYCEFIFNKKLDVNENIMNINRADLYLYLNNDVPHVQDGTRLDAPARDLLDASHRSVLAAHDIDFVEIRGSWRQRFEQAVFHIRETIKERCCLHRG
jgi:HTH-type transcriptional regulator, transcriptional repressor of NAD biosynthesis genes